MKLLLKNVVVIFIALVGMLFTQSSFAEAAANEIAEFEQSVITDGDGRSWLHLVFTMDKKKEIEYVVSENPDKPRQLIVRLKNTSFDDYEVAENYTLDTKIGRYMTIGKGETKEDEKDTYIKVVAGKSLAEQDYKVYSEPYDKKLKRKYRIIIDIASDKVEKPVEVGTLEGLEGHTIVVDPGHGGSDIGARGHRGVHEADVNLAVSMKMLDILKQSGARVIMTRTEDVDVFGPGASDTEELQARCDYVDRKTEIFVCVHSNSAENESASGTETYYHSSSRKGKMLARAVQNNLCEATGFNDRGIKTANFYVLRNTSVPSILIELGFLSNYAEEKQLNDAEMQDKMALGICQGIADYFMQVSPSVRKK